MPLQSSLKGNSRFRRFWLGRLLANTAQNAILFALLVVVVNRTGSTIHASLLVLSFVVPAAVLGVIGGVVVDHLPRRGMLVFCSLLRAALCVVFLRSNESVWIIYGTNLALSAVSQFSGPAESAVVPSLVDAEQIASATALLNVGVIVAQVAGTVILAPLFLKTAGPDPLFFLTILLFAGAAMAYATMPRLARRPDEDESEPARPRFVGIRASAHESWQLMRENRSVFLSGIQQTVVTTTLVVLISLLPNYTKRALGLPPEDAVYVFAPAAIGVALGNWLVPRLVRGQGKSLLAGGGFLMFLASLSCLGLEEQIVSVVRGQQLLGPIGALSPRFFYGAGLTAGLLAIPVGFGYAIVLACARLITYEHVPAQMQGRVFAFQGVLSALASIIPLLLAGVMTHVFGPRYVLVVVAGIDFAAFIYARTTLPPRTRSRAIVGLRGTPPGL